MCACLSNTSVTTKLIGHCSKPVDDISRRHASMLLLDWLGCILVGQSTQAGQALRRYTKRFTPTFGNCFNATGESLNALDAAFANGGLGNILEMDDLHRQSLLHTGDTVMSAALAVAQDTSAEMTQLLDAIVKGYEVAIQIGLIAASGGYSAWYNSSTCGVFGAGMAASVLLKLSDEETLDALAQCGMMASGLWQCRLESGYSKQLATAHAAHSGVMAAMLASENFPGPRQILEGELGFFNTLYPEVNDYSLSVDDDSDWRINEVSVKPWPACRHTHPVIEAALAIRPELRINDIATIEIGSYRSGIDFCDKPLPATDHEARFSFQFCVATTLLYGSPQVQQFSTQARLDSSLCELMDRMTVVDDDRLEDNFPALLGGRITMRLTNDRVISKTINSALGDPENPMSLDKMRSKFKSLADAAGVNDKTRDTVVEYLTGARFASLSALSKNLSAISHQLEEQRHVTK